MNWQCKVTGIFSLSWSYTLYAGLTVTVQLYLASCVSFILHSNITVARTVVPSLNVNVSDSRVSQMRGVRRDGSEAAGVELWSEICLILTRTAYTSCLKALDCSISSVKQINLIGSAPLAKTHNTCTLLINSRTCNTSLLNSQVLAMPCCLTHNHSSS